MNALQAFIWVLVGVIALQSIAIVILSGGWGLFFTSRRYAYAEDIDKLKIQVKTNDNRLDALTNELRAAKQGLP